MRLETRRLSGEAGGAMVEFALVSLILVPTMLYAIYFQELTFAKLKLNEASRYLVWEMTVFPLSDWKHSHPDHQKKFDDAKKTIIQEVVERYADDLDGSTPRLVPNYKAHKPMTIEVSIPTEQIELTNADPKILEIGGFGAGNSVANAMFDAWKFNKNGKVTGSIQMKVKNVWLRKRNTMLIGYTEKMLTADEYTMKCTQSLIADAWDVKDGSAVAGLQNKAGCEDDSDNGPFCQQVANMHMFGLGNFLGSAMNGISGLFDGAGVHSPFEASVKSLPLDGTSNSKDTLDIAQPECHDEHSGTPKQYHTNVYKDRWDHNKSRYFKVYDKLGGCYMGCPKPLQQDGQCKWDGGSAQHKNDCK